MAKNYGIKEYEEDAKKFEPESIGKGEALSDKAFEAQKRMNANPELGKKYFSGRYKEYR